MKPNTTDCMLNLLQQVRIEIPFSAPESQICSGLCQGCSKKLIEYLDMVIEEWEIHLSDGVTPNFGDIERIVKISKKIYQVLKRNNVIITQ